MKLSTSTSSPQIDAPISRVESPLNAVEAYIGSEYGMSLKAANGRYLTHVYRSRRQAIDAARETRAPSTRFEASALDGKLVLKGDNGRYLGRIYRDNQYLEADKEKVDICSQFRVFLVGNGLIALQGDNDMFVSMIQRGKHSSIEISKEGIDEDCKFMPGVGDLIPPKFEIVNIAWDESAASVNYQPSVVVSDTYNNGGSNPVDHVFTLSWEENNPQITTWQRPWGVEFKHTLCTRLPGTFIAKHEFSIHLSYGEDYGTMSKVPTTTKLERKIPLHAAAKQKTVVSLIVKKADDVAIPFTAKITRTKANGTLDIFEEEGTWHGTAYQSADINIEELPLDSKLVLHS